MPVQQAADLEIGHTPGPQESNERKGIGVLNQAEAPAEQVWARLEPLERENAQLREALASRIVIEQAKGVLTERYRLDPGRAFELLRSSARSERRQIHDLAGEVVGSRRSPAGIEALAAKIAAPDGRGSTVRVRQRAFEKGLHRGN